MKTCIFWIVIQKEGFFSDYDHKKGGFLIENYVEEWKGGKVKQALYKEVIRWQQQICMNP